MKDIYEPEYVEILFDRMSESYSRMNNITSFGFSEKWRKQCVSEVDIEKGKMVVDLMTGMGECWKFILKKADSKSKLIGLDFSYEMVQRAEKYRAKLKPHTIEILRENVFGNSIKDESADYVVSGFGLKTFNDNQLRKLAFEINRILKPNGKIALIDISVPKNKVLRIFYLFYLKNVIPLLGKLLLGNPETYKMLGIYTQNFKNSEGVFQIFNNPNFEVEYLSYFFGCATGIKGRKI